MIHYRLRCDEDHEFEGWFNSADGFDAQAAAGEIECPVCGSSRVERAIMAPRIGKAKSEMEASRKAMVAKAEMIRQLKAVRTEIEQKFTYVGPRFPEEVRKIHYGETEAKDVYGEATLNEAKDLVDEGIEIAAVPWIDVKEH